MTRRRLGRLGRFAAIGVCITLVGTQSAQATVATPNAKAYSAPGYFGTASMAASLSLSGSVGGLLAPIIQPIIDNALNPLVNGLQGSLDTGLSAAIGSSSALTAGTPTVQSTPAPGTFPNDLPSGLPSPCSTSSTTKPCYSGTGGVAAVTLGSLGTVKVAAASGYTQQVDSSADSSNPMFGRAKVASVSVGVLPALVTLPASLVAVSTIDSKSNCPNSGSNSPTASVSAAQVQLVNGLITVNVAATGGISSVIVGGVTYSLSNLPSTAVGGFTLSKYGSSSLKLSLTLSISQLIAALGLSGTAVNDLVGSVLANQSLTLAVIIGSGSTTTSSSAQAWGLNVGVDLAGSLGFNLLGLIGATVSVPTGIGGGNLGNLLDARFGYTSCSTGSNSSGSTAVVPATLI